MASNDVTEPAVLQPISARQGIVLSLSIEGSRRKYLQLVNDRLDRSLRNQPVSLFELVEEDGLPVL